jgi:hypothetical protein
MSKKYSLHLYNYEGYGYSVTIIKEVADIIRSINSKKSSPNGAKPSSFIGLELLFCPSEQDIKNIIKIVNSDTWYSEQVSLEKEIHQRQIEVDWVAGDLFPHWHTEANPAKDFEIKTCGVYLS